MISKNCNPIISCSSVGPGMAIYLNSRQPTLDSNMQRHDPLKLSLVDDIMVKMADCMKEQCKFSHVMGVSKASFVRWMESHCNVSLQGWHWTISGRHNGGNNTTTVLDAEGQRALRNTKIEGIRRRIE